MKAKILAVIFFALITISAFGQDINRLNGYKYIYVGTLKYQNRADDRWGISNRIREYFEKKGFVVLNESSSVPEEIKGNPCLSLNCGIEHSGTDEGTNFVIIKLTNCKGEVVFSNQGRFMGLTFQGDMTGATKRALAPLNMFRYTFNPSVTPTFDSPEIDKTGETEDSLRSYLSTGKLDPIEGIYNSRQDVDMAYYRFAIVNRKDKLEAIIIESSTVSWSPGEVKAIFEPASVQGFYAVRWYMANKNRIDTFAKLENGALLSIELTNPSTKEKSQNYFIKMFPSVTGGDTSLRPRGTRVTGSGFFISTSGIVATNAHVIEGSSEIEITVVNELGTSIYKAKVLLADNKNDVALLKIDDERFKGLTSIPFGIVEKAAAGEKVFTIGFPMNDIMGNNYKVTDGIISAQTGIADDVRYFQITVPIQPGNSGGPLFNKAGNVVGLTTAKLNSKAVGTDIENVNYAIKASYLTTLYNMLPNAEKLGASSKVENKSLEDQVKVLKNYVCLINAR